MLKKLSLTSKIILSCGLPIFILGLALLLNHNRLTQITSSANKTVDQNAAIAFASLKVSSGVGHSQTALGNWLLLGASRYREERARVWHKEIEPAMANLAALTNSWSHQRDQQVFSELESTLRHLRQAEDEVQDLPDGISEQRRQLTRELTPLTTALANNMTDLLQEERGLAAGTTRKDILRQLATAHRQAALASAALTTFMRWGAAKSRENFRHQSQSLKATVTSLTGQPANLTPGQNATLTKVQENINKITNLATKAFDLRQHGEWSSRQYLLQQKVAPLAQAVEQQLQAIFALEQQQMNVDLAQARRQAGRLTWGSWLMIACGLFVGLLAVLFLRRLFRRPLQQIFGPLTKFSSQEIGKAVAHYRGSVTQLDKETHNITTNSAAMATTASQQADNLHKLASSLQEVTNQTKTSQDDAQAASAIARQASDAAQVGNEAMGRMSNAIQDIKSSADETAKIISTIDEIAFKTNLLALNAAVEAARAGEAGSGFAVVAEEVRNLARRSAEAARTSTELIDESQDHAASGVDASSEVAEVLSQIVDSVDQVATLNNKMATSSAEQCTGIDQISAGISILDEAIQSTAQQAQHLSGKALKIQQTVKMLANVAVKQPVTTSPRPRHEKIRPGKAPTSTHHKQPRLSPPTARPQRRPRQLASPPQPSPQLQQKHQGKDAFIRWSPELSVRVQLIDQQHLRLVDITNDLYCAARDKKGAAEVKRIYKELCKYTAFHFKDEERKMAKVGYPDLRQHQQLHKKLLAKVEEFQQRIAQQEDGIEKALLKFLKSWLIDHIGRQDAKYSPYFHKKGIH